MSDGLNEPKYCNAHDLWQWIKEQRKRTEMQLHDCKHFNAEGISALLLGRQELLTLLCDWLENNERTIAKEEK